MYHGLIEAEGNRGGSALRSGLVHDRTAYLLGSWIPAERILFHQAGEPPPTVEGCPDIHKAEPALDIYQN